MKQITKGDVELLRWVKEDTTHQIRWRARTVSGTRRIVWYDYRTPITPRVKRLVEAGMVVDPTPFTHLVGGCAELTALGARVLVVFDENLATHRDADVAASRTTTTWKRGGL